MVFLRARREGPGGPPPANAEDSFWLGDIGPFNAWHKRSFRGPSWYRCNSRPRMRRSGLNAF